MCQWMMSVHNYQIFIPVILHEGLRDKHNFSALSAAVEQESLQ